MIRKPNDWESIQAFMERKKLPVGAYVCKIKQAVVKNTQWGDQLNILYDIEDGEYAGFYAKDFESQQSENKKWKGIIRYFLPTEDGSEKDGYTKRRLKGFITAVEQSNMGFTFNWDERTLAGKLVGIIYQNREWEYNGKTGWSAQPFRATNADNVADGNFTLPEDKPLKKDGSSGFGYAATASGFAELPNEEDLPF